MTELLVDGDHLVVRLTPLEKFLALRGDVRVPLTALHAVEVVDDPFRSIRGLRAPGTGFPRQIALGTWRSSNGKDFVAVSRGKRGVVVELEGTPFRRLVLAVDDPDGIRARLTPAPSRLEP